MDYFHKGTGVLKPHHLAYVKETDKDKDYVKVLNTLNNATTSDNYSDVYSGTDQMTKDYGEASNDGKAMRGVMKKCRKELFLSYYRKQFEEAIQAILPIIYCRVIVKNAYLYDKDTNQHDDKNVMYERVRGKCMVKDTKTCSEDTKTDEEKAWDTWDDLVELEESETFGKPVKFQWRTKFLNIEYVKRIKYLKLKSLLSKLSTPVTVEDLQNKNYDDYKAGEKECVEKSEVFYTESSSPKKLTFDSGSGLKKVGDFYDMKLMFDLPSTWSTSTVFNKFRMLDEWKIYDGEKTGGCSKGAIDSVTCPATWHDTQDATDTSKVCTKSTTIKRTIDENPISQRVGRQYSDRGCTDVPLFFLFGMDSEFIDDLVNWDPGIDSGTITLTTIKNKFKTLMGITGELNEEMFHSHNYNAQSLTWYTDYKAFVEDSVSNSDPGVFYDDTTETNDDETFPRNIYSNLKLLAHLYGDDLKVLNGTNVASTPEGCSHGAFNKIFRVGRFINLVDDMINNELIKVSTHYEGGYDGRKIKLDDLTNYYTKDATPVVADDLDANVPESLKPGSTTGETKWTSQIDWSWIVQRHDWYTMENIDSDQQQVYYIDVKKRKPIFDPAILDDPVALKEYDNPNYGKLYFYKTDTTTSFKNEYMRDIEGKHPYCSVLKNRLGKIMDFTDPLNVEGVNKDASFSGNAFHTNYNKNLNSNYWDNEINGLYEGKITQFNHDVTGTCVFQMKGLADKLVPIIYPKVNISKDNTELITTIKSSGFDISFITEENVT